MVARVVTRVRMGIMDIATIEERLDAIAPLAEPVRRALYLYVIGRPEAVGREEAASAIGIGRALAAFHLDRLVEVGLLTPEYRRISGRTGPGAGRPAKLYRRADGQVDVSIPERRDELVARLFAMALDADRLGTASSADTLERVARAYGTALGGDARRRAGPRPSRARLAAAATGILAESGFEPVLDGPAITLRNCPFDRVARHHRDLVCGMNRSIMDGLVAGLRSSGLQAMFDPQPERCCMTLVTKGTRPT
jgi:predicted ArsR family transcriptional regulator